MVAARLADLGVWTTRGSVERLIKGLPPYQGRRPGRVESEGPRLDGGGLYFGRLDWLDKDPDFMHRPQVPAGFVNTWTRTALAIRTIGAVFPLYPFVVAPKL